MNFFKRLFGIKPKDKTITIANHNCREHFSKWKKSGFTYQVRYCEICNLEQVRNQFDRV